MKFVPIKPTQKTYSFVGKIQTKEQDNTNTVFITPFEVKETYIDYPVLNYKDDNINTKYCIFNTYDLYHLLPKLTKIDINVLLAIIYNLECDTNLVKFSANNYSIQIGKHFPHILQAVNDLIHFNIIAKTNSQNAFIINHNLFYKGDLNKFVFIYNNLYSNKSVEYDDKGRIIIKH